MSGYRALPAEPSDVSLDDALLAASHGRVRFTYDDQRIVMRVGWTTWQVLLLVPHLFVAAFLSIACASHGAGGVEILGTGVFVFGLPCLAALWLILSRTFNRTLVEIDPFSVVVTNGPFSFGRRREWTVRDVAAAIAARRRAASRARGDTGSLVALLRSGTSAALVEPGPPSPWDRAALEEMIEAWIVAKAAVRRRP